MIQVVVWRDSGQQIRGIDLDGHAGYGEEGEDIVCAAVSALVLNMANSVEAFTEDTFSGEAAAEGGGFSFHFTEERSVGIQTSYGFSDSWFKSDQRRIWRTIYQYPT